MYRIRKSIDIDFSHHVRGHAGACINLHGHTWKFEVGLAAAELDAQGFVIDFKHLKREVLAPCSHLLDHGLAMGEALYGAIGDNLEQIGTQLLATRAEQDRDLPTRGVDGELCGARNAYPGGMKVAVFPFSPTSERLARWLYELAVSRLQDDRVQVEYARIFETLHPVESVAEYGP